jgi:hypothetical protein
MVKKMFFPLLAVLALGCCGGSGDSGKFSPAALEQIRKAREIAITVAVEPSGLVPLQMSVQRIVERVFAGLGLTVATDPGAFPVFEVRVRAAAVSKDYWVDLGYGAISYSGARVKGEMALAQTNKDKFLRVFSGRQDPPKNIADAIEDPLDAPFAAALEQSDFLPALAGLVDACWGLDKALAVFAGLYDVSPPLRPWRLAVLRSVEFFSDDKATAALRGILARHVEALSDPSAATAFDECTVKLLEVLVARNDRASRPAVVRLAGKLQAYVHYGVWGDSRSYLEGIASRLQ